MTHNLKALGLALLAVFAIGAVAASAASAVNFHSNTTSGTTHLTGIQVGTNQFDLANGTPFKCTGVIWDATYAGTTASDLTFTTTQTGCTAAGQKAEILNNGCTDTITTPAGSGDAYTAVKDLVCPVGKSIEIKVPTAGCTFIIGAQTAGGSVDLTDVTTATANQDDILLKLTTSTNYTTVGGGICGAAGVGKTTGEVTLKAYNNAAHTEQRDLAIF